MKEVIKVVEVEVEVPFQRYERTGSENK